MGTRNNRGNGFLRAQTSKGVKITRLRLVLFYSGNLYAKKKNNNNNNKQVWNCLDGLNCP